MRRPRPPPGNGGRWHGGPNGRIVGGREVFIRGDRFRRYIGSMELAAITCPTCFEVFEVTLPHPDEMPTEVDYDCEICCRPMVIVFTEHEAYAKGLGE